MFERTVHQHAFSVSEATLERNRKRGVDRVVRSQFTGGHHWQVAMTNDRLPDGWWHDPSQHGGWKEARAPFGNSGVERSAWNTKFLQMHTTFEHTGRARGGVLFARHDDSLRVWLNGTEIANAPTFSTDGHSDVLTREQLGLLKKGKNVLAVEVHNHGGVSGADIGLALLTRGRVPRDPAGVRAMAGPEPATIRAVRKAFLPALRIPATLFAGELDAERSKMAANPIDLRDLSLFLAADLTLTKGKQQRRARRMLEVGDLDLAVEVTDLPDGSGDRLQVTMKSVPVKRESDDPRHIERVLAPQIRYSLRGKLEIERRFGGEAGVASFRAKLDAEVTNKDKQEFRIATDETWAFQDTWHSKHPDFNNAVVSAIRNGGVFLQGQLRNLSATELVEGNDATTLRTNGTGRIAVSLLAMLHAGISKDDPVLRAGFDAIRKRRLNDTYSVASAIMAIEALHAPARERQDLLDGIIDLPQQRQLPPEDLEVVQRLTGKLLDANNGSGKKARFWYYNDNGLRYDHSTHQYALLGLYSAELCGVQVPERIWQGAARHLISDQGPAEQRIDLELGFYGRDDDAPFRRPTALAGWGYEQPEDGGVKKDIYGSMTAAGITGLRLCQAAAERRGFSLERDTEDAIMRGHAWFARWFSPRRNPESLHRGRKWFYYYAYGVERACELGRVRTFQDRDWYFELATVLVRLQHADGGWPEDDSADSRAFSRAAFSVLFLKKAALPATTGKR